MRLTPRSFAGSALVVLALLVTACSGSDDGAGDADDRAPIDCFYVYPTISTDPEEISDRVPGDAERFVTLNQVARLGEVCRRFAPVYRQRTLAGLGGALAGSGLTTTTVAGDLTPGETDVRDAFAHYMENDNQGRGVLLAGWAEGASISTPFVSTPGLVRGECVERDGFSYLSVDVPPVAPPRRRRRATLLDRVVTGG